VRVPGVGCRVSGSRCCSEGALLLLFSNLELPATATGAYTLHPTPETRNSKP